MKLVYPEIGTTVEIFLPARKGRPEEHYLARVLEETPKGLILSAFESDEKTVLPQVRARIRMRFNQKDASYEFESVVLQRKETPFKLCYVAKPLALARKQMRAFLRVDCQLPVSLVRQDDAARKLVQGVITNLSAGGCTVLITEHFPADTLLDMRFELGEGGRLVDNVSAKVLTHRAAAGGAQLHVLQFEAVDNEVRDAMVRYTFRLQQAARRTQKTGRRG